jgi:hypothetical protein
MTAEERRQRVLPQSSRPEEPDEEEAAYRLLTKHFDSSILNHMDFRKHLDNKRFELYCHANSNDVAKASHDIQNIRM